MIVSGASVDIHRFINKLLTIDFKKLTHLAAGQLYMNLKKSHTLVYYSNLVKYFGNLISQTYWASSN